MQPSPTCFDLAILGAGASGMMAAIAAATASAAAGKNLRFALFEKNPRPGLKVLACGGGRCNFTNADTPDQLLRRYGRHGRFLAPALQHLDNLALREFFASLGVPSHVEPGGKVFPDSNQARSIVDALVTRMSDLGVQLFTQHTITAVQHTPAQIENPFTLTTATGTIITARAVILALGGMSYPCLGSVGDGYRFAAALGHTLVTPRPAIVGLIAQDPWIKDLQGLAVRNIAVTIVPPKTRNSKPETRNSVGDLLFTHFGISGPAILNPSADVAELLEASPTVTLHLDFLPHTAHDAAHATLRSWQQHHGKKRLRSMLADPAPEILITTTNPDQTASEIENHTPDGKHLENKKLKIENPLTLPARLAVTLCALEHINPDQPCAHLTAAQIHRLVERLKRCPVTITATRGFSEAMVTAGGVSLRQVDPHSLESRLVPNLFLTGEVLDLTGPTGGYNLQLAFSTGHLAGATIGRRLGSL